MLDQIKLANSVFSPQRILIYGVQGIGKNTFASTFEKPVLIQTEEGSEAIEIPAFPLATSYQDVVDQINALFGDHDYRTAIIDTADWLEPLLWDACCVQNNWTSIETPGYGKGYIELDKWWRCIMDGLNQLRHQKQMNIVVLAHSEIKRIEPPDSDPYDTYQIKMQKRAFALWQEWADMVLFLNYKVHMVKTKKGMNEERVRAAGSGDRVIYTSERPAWKAKNRWSLPDEILIGKDRTWKAFHDQMEAATGGKYKNPYGVSDAA